MCVLNSHFPLQVAKTGIQIYYKLLLMQFKVIRNWENYWFRTNHPYDKL